MNISKLIRYILGFILIAYIIFATYDFTRGIVFQGEKITRCGTVTFKSSYDQKHKHSTSIEFVLVVKYDDTGRKEDEDVSASTWSSYDVGDRICFTSTKRIESGFIPMVHGIIGMVGFVICCLAILALCIFSVKWIFTGDFWFKDEDDD